MNKSFGDTVSDYGGLASVQSENREKGICLDPRKREPIGHRCNRAGAGFFSE